MSDSTQLFTQLFEAHRPAVIKLCRGYMKGDAMAAEDLAQEVFVQVWRSLDRFRGEASAKTWIYRITVNTCLQELRTRSRRPQISEGLSAISSASAKTPDEDPRLHRLYQAIGTLSKIDRLVYMLMLEGQDYSEIAQVTGLTPGALRVRVHRAHEKLRKLLSDVRSNERISEPVASGQYKQCSARHECHSTCPWTEARNYSSAGSDDFNSLSCNRRTSVFLSLPLACTGAFEPRGEVVYDRKFTCENFGRADRDFTCKKGRFL